MRLASLLLPLIPSVVATLTPGRALAGPLAQTVRGVENKVSTHSGGGGGGSSRPPSPPPSYGHDDKGSRHDSDRGTATASAAVTTGFWAGSAYDGGGGEERDGSAPDAAIVLGPGRLDLYLGAEAVVGSDGAATGEIRASKGWLGLAASETHYAERIMGKPGVALVTMDLASFTVGARMLAAGGSELWLDGGGAVTGSTNYATLVGWALGLRGEQAINPDLSFVAQGRYSKFEHDVSAMEGWLGVRAWFVAVGYRALRFDVGPVLHGPEAGVALRF